MTVQSHFSRQFALALVMTLVFAVAGSIGFYCSKGSSTLAAAALAGSVCWLGAALAVWIHARLSTPQWAILALGLSMLTRMGLPMILLVCLFFYRGGLDKSQVIYYVLVFYFAALVLDTWLAIPKRPPPSSPTAGNR
jgi:hypothetical protein